VFFKQEGLGNLSGPLPSTKSWNTSSTISITSPCFWICLLF
jgi:hypothetical protein